MTVINSALLRFLSPVFGIVLLTSLTSSAYAERLVAALSNTSVFITSDYGGASITIFGTVERDAQTVPRVGTYDIVITVRGPRQTLTVREKQRLGFVWLNRDQRKFQEIPAFIGVLTSRPLAEITSEALRNRFKIGLEAIINAPDVSGYLEPHEKPRFREALIRLRKADNHFIEKPSSVTFLTPSLFSSTIAIPATSPPGTYDVEVALFVDNTLLDRHYLNFELIKSGVEQKIGDLSKDYALLYGLAVAFMALFFGWLANILFRRD